MTGIELIRAERKRQIEVEKYTPEHDDDYYEPELTFAAMCYEANEKFDEIWPWCNAAWESESKLRNKIKAAALYQAEIDRLQRRINRIATEIDLANVGI